MDRLEEFLKKAESFGICEKCLLESYGDYLLVRCILSYKYNSNLTKLLELIEMYFSVEEVPETENCTNSYLEFKFYRK